MSSTENRQELFEHIPVSSAVRKMAMPAIFGQMVILIYNMADTFFLGRTNNPYMVAGASLILPVFNICLSIAGLLGIGGGALVSRLLGGGDAEEAGKVSAFSFYCAIAVAGSFSLIMLLGMNPILSLLGASGNTLPFARQYAACVIVLGAVPTVMSNVMSNLLRSVGASGSAGFGVAMGGIINIALDPIFMFVLMPKGSEVIGAGLATALSNCIACVYFGVVIIGMRNQVPLSFRLKDAAPRGTSIRSIFGVGVPSAVATLLFDIDYVVIDKLMSAYGDMALAAVGIVLKAERLPLNAGIGICQGMLPLVAYNYASGDRKRMFAIIRFSLAVGLAIGFGSVLCYEVFAGRIMQLFIANEETVRLGTSFLRLRALATPLMFCSFFTVYIFQGFGKGRISLFLGVVRWAVFNIPMLFLLNHLVGMYGLVLSQVCADILTVTLSAIVYFRYKRKYL